MPIDPITLEARHRAEVEKLWTKIRQLTATSEILARRLEKFESSSTIPPKAASETETK